MNYNGGKNTMQAIHDYFYLYPYLKIYSLSIDDIIIIFNTFWQVYESAYLLLRKRRFIGTFSVWETASCLLLFARRWNRILRRIFVLISMKKITIQTGNLKKDIYTCV
jgi:hypothetical protein